MNKPESGRVGSPQPVEKDNSLFSAEKHKSTAGFAAPDWCPHTQTITWDTGLYKAVDGKIIDIVPDHRRCHTPAQMRGIKQAYNLKGDTAGRWRPCRIGYTEYSGQITLKNKGRDLRPVIIIPDPDAGEEEA